jgi:hypothetical protein
MPLCSLIKNIMDIYPHIGERLTKLNVDFGKKLSIWEHKTFNIHRAVVYWDASNLQPTIDDIRNDIRTLIKDNFKVRFWRGFGFGSITELSELPDDIGNFEKCVDQRDNRNGTWQWAVIIGNNSKKYLSNHTWAKGYLTPVYESLLNYIQSSGYTSAT